MVHNNTSSSYRSVDCIGLSFCLVSLSILHVALYVWSSWYYIFICYILFLLVSWAWWDWLTTFLQCCDTICCVIWPVKSFPKWPIMCRMGCCHTIPWFRDVEGNACNWLESRLTMAKWKWTTDVAAYQCRGSYRWVQLAQDHHVPPCIVIDIV